MPKSYVRLGETWRTHHPEWDMKLWDAYPLRNQRLYDEAASYVPSQNVGQFRADIMRLEILYDHGGVYLDCDFECLRPIDGLLGGVSCFVAWEVQDVWANNAIMGAVPHHPWVGELIERLPARAEAMKGKRPNLISGPHYITSRLSPEVTVFPQAWFYPYGFSELHRGGEDFPGAYAKHHWGNRRRMQGRPL